MWQKPSELRQRRKFALHENSHPVPSVRESKTVLEITGEVWASVMFVRDQLLIREYSRNDPIVKKKAEATKKSFPSLLRVSK